MTPATRTATTPRERLVKGFGWGYNESHADVAQPEEQRFRKPQVKGSSPFIGSIFSIRAAGVLRTVLMGWQHSARVATRARILLKIDEGWKAPQVASALDVAEGTVYRVKRRYADEGLDGVLHDRVQANRFRKLDDKAEVHPVSSTGQALIALACSDAPEGHQRWTLELLADQMVELGVVESLSYETVRLKLKKRPQALAEATVVHPEGRR